MSGREMLYREIKAELMKTNGLKARRIARLISAEKKEVNRILYNSEYSGQFRRDSSFVWYLVTEEPKQVKETSKSNCKNCMLYKSDECFGAKKTCEFYKHSPSISKEEMAMWPTEMSGPYGTLHIVE